VTQNFHHVNEADYEQAVNSFYEGLYRFAFSLAGQRGRCLPNWRKRRLRGCSPKADSCANHSKVKAWLFTTVYRIYLGWKRRETRFPHLEIASVEHELPPVTLETVDNLENEALSRSLLELEER